MYTFILFVNIFFLLLLNDMSVFYNKYVSSLLFTIIIGSAYALIGARRLHFA